MVYLPFKKLDFFTLFNNDFLSSEHLVYFYYNKNKNANSGMQELKFFLVFDFFSLVWLLTKNQENIAKYVIYRSFFERFYVKSYTKIILFLHTWVRVFILNFWVLSC